MQTMKNKRGEKQLTQEQLAELVGVDRSTITKIENGGRPSVDTAKTIASFLDFEWTLFFESTKRV
jgi:transcriptional regulator with XRE-family HTH domain